MKHISIELFKKYKSVLDGYVFYKIDKDGIINLYQVIPSELVKNILLTF